MSEIDIIESLSNFRKRSTNYVGPSFDTICGSGPNGAIIHYKANLKTNRILRNGDLILIDSGGQYLEGTTDITRTIGFGKVDHLRRKHYTLVLKGMIAISKLKWPIGLSGKDLDSIARYNLWQENLDYEHGTGHGVGSFLSVHEGPQAISKRNEVELKPGMIVSNEPGYYLKNSHGIRIENLLLIKEPKKLTRMQKIPTLYFETLTYCPLDKELIITLEKYKPDLVVLAGFMRILSPVFVNRYLGKLINIHPSLLPKYKGLNTHKRVLNNKEKYSGCTVHFVNSKLDGGIYLVPLSKGELFNFAIIFAKTVHGLIYEP